MKWSQQQDLEEILSERARRFYSPTAGKTLSADGRPRERCILVTVDRTTTGPGTSSTPSSSPIITSIEMPKFSCEESLEELCELVGTAGLVVAGCLIQRLPQPHSQSYIGSGKIKELADLIKAPLPISSSNSDLLPQDDEITVVVVDDDLTPKQQRNLEDGLQSYGVPANVKVLDRTAIILEIFAQHAQSKEGQLQVELAMLQYRLNRGPKARGGHYDSGCGFRGPGETKLETDKRIIRDKIVQLKHDIDQLSQHRLQHRVNRLKQLHLPVVALVGYTNAGKSTLMNKISHAGVLAENMLFATLDPTTRKVVVPKIVKKKNDNEEGESESEHESHKGQEILLTDTVGFISKLPTHLIAAFR
jgi:GTP-binding protein HflX